MDYEYNNENSISSRILTAKKIIRDATMEALKQAQVTETLEGIHLSPNNDDANTNSNTNANTNSNTNANTNANANATAMLPTAITNEAASFDLGMTLFGNDPIDMELRIHEDLTKVEDELCEYFHSLENTPTDYNSNDNDINHKNHNNKNNSEMTDSASSLRLQSQQLQTKIAFLKDCSRARVALEEASMSFLASPTLLIGGGGGGGVGKDANVDNSNKGTTSNNKSKGPLMQVALHLQTATKALRDASRHVPPFAQKSTSTEATQKEEHDSHMDRDIAKGDIQVANQILNSLSSE